MDNQPIPMFWWFGPIERTLENRQRRDKCRPEKQGHAPAPGRNSGIEQAELAHGIEIGEVPDPSGATRNGIGNP